MKKLIHYALNQPLFIVLGLLLFVLAGVTAFKNLSVEAFPDVTDTQVTVIALYPGRAAEEVEKQVTLPLETALSGLPNSIRVFSHTQFGLSFTVITFDEKADVNLARQQVNERLASVDLPQGAQVNIAPNATPVGEIMRYRVRGDGLSTTDLRTIEDWTIERSLRQVPGVADVVAMGGFIKQYEVQPDLDKLRAYKLTFQNLLDALGRGNSNAGGSYVAQGAQQFAIRGIGLLRSPEEIGQIVLDSRNGSPILIRDVAQIKLGAVPRLGTTGQDEDDDAVIGIVIMRKGENPSLVLKAVKDRIAQLNDRGLPQGVQIVPFYDRTWLMNKTLSTVFKNMVEGAVLVALVLYLFLSNLRATLAVVVIIPLALLSTFMGLKIMGVPANLLSLGAMDFGIIVDGAVIVIENILHRLSQNREDMPESERKQTIMEGRNGAMPPFGAAFKPEQITDVAQYVLSLSGRSTAADAAKRGEETFKTTCAACHGPEGKGNQALGAPNLTDNVWLYGGSLATVTETIAKGRQGQMPAHKDLLGEPRVHLLAAYVYAQSQEQAAAPKK